jgi:hypothetical protein
VSDDFRLTRRDLLQMVAAVVTTASFAARRPLFAPAVEVASAEPDAEARDDESLLTDIAQNSRLERFLRSRGIRPAHLSRESGYSRQFLLRVRLGRVQPTRCCIARVVQACRRLTRGPVRARDLFDLPSAASRVVERMPLRLID